MATEVLEIQAIWSDVQQIVTRLAQTVGVQIGKTDDMDIATVLRSWIRLADLRKRPRAVVSKQRLRRRCRA